MCVCVFVCFCWAERGKGGGEGAVRLIQWVRGLASSSAQAPVTSL